MKADMTVATVHGLRAPRARPTAFAALWLALVLSLPVGGVLFAAELAWRWLVP